MHLMTIGILQENQNELIELMQDKTKTPIQKLTYTMMYDDITESIKVSNREFFEVKT